MEPVHDECSVREARSRTTTQRAVVRFNAEVFSVEAANERLRRNRFLSARQ
jgi:hypothetical protein